MSSPSFTPRKLQIAATCCLLALAALCLATELWLNPIRPGGSWLALKAIPLLASLRGFVYGKRRSFQWMSLLVWLYFMEGAVRAASDAAPRWGYIEATLALLLFAVSATYARTSGRSQVTRPPKQAGE